MNPTATSIDMPVLPGSVAAYKKTPLFSETTIPKGLLKDHQTKPGVWGLITINSGELKYHITETNCQATHLLGPNNAGVVVPQQRHHIEATGKVEFSVEFYRQHD